MIPNGECLEYSGCIGAEGYGVFWMQGKSQSSHRASYMLNVGEIPTGKSVLHKCDNRKCINPDHLYLGTHSENMRDARERGRTAIGDRHPSKTHPYSFKRSNAIFSDKDCIDMFLSGTHPKKLAKHEGVCLSTIYRAIRRGPFLLSGLVPEDLSEAAVVWADALLTQLEK